MPVTKSHDKWQLLWTHYQKPVIAAVVLFLLVLAYLNRFVQDDAFISCRYAWNLVQGNGLVWNIGEPVEGYTNFLWTLILCVPLLLKIKLIAFSMIVGLFCFLGTLTITFKLTSSVLRCQKKSLLVILLLGTNYTFSAYATGGLETQLQALLFVSAFTLIFQTIQKNLWGIRRLIIISIIFSLALLTRLDSCIPFAVLFPILFTHLFRRKSPFRQKGLQAAALILPALCILGSWFVWKIIYYGDILPNTFYAKTAIFTSGEQGLIYLLTFLRSYGLLLPLIAALFVYRKWISDSLEMKAITLITVFWCAYIVLVGGDFMEFRFLVPILPFVFIILVRTLSIIQPKSIQVALICWILAGSWIHATHYSKYQGIESIRELKGHLAHPDQNWDQVGKVLERLFSNQESDVIIATTAAGAVPYYSRLKTIDMLGINDKWIARNGLRLGNRPGHQRIATYDYLRRRKVNLVLGQPIVEPRHITVKTEYTVRDLIRFLILDIEDKPIPKNARVIEIPLNDSHKLTLLYLYQDEWIDHTIETENLQTFPVIG